MLVARALERAAVRALAARLSRVAPPGPILEVGAPDTRLRDSLRARGRKIEYLEREPRSFSPAAADLARGSGDWAAIVFRHSLEHLQEPGDALIAASRQLLPGGVLAAEVATTASLASSTGPRERGRAESRIASLPAQTVVDALDGLGLWVSAGGDTSGRRLLSTWAEAATRGEPGRAGFGETTSLAMLGALEAHRGAVYAEALRV